MWVCVCVQSLNGLSHFHRWMNEYQENYNDCKTMTQSKRNIIIKYTKWISAYPWIYSTVHKWDVNAMSWAYIDNKWSTKLVDFLNWKFYGKQYELVVLLRLVAITLWWYYLSQNSIFPAILKLFLTAIYS